jgi:DNA processing protein
MAESHRDLLIALSLLPYLTPNRTRLLREHFDPLESLRHAPTRLLESLLSVTPAQAEEVRSPLTLAVRQRVASLRDSVVALDDDDYPPRLREIHDPPLVLHFTGDRSLLTQPSVAIVGSRRASPYAMNVADQLARELAATGLAVVSGLARGVDASAHAAALDVGGTTIAVLGTGIDIIYPPGNAKLFRRIAEKGVIVSEFAPGMPPLSRNFPIRNRVISGLSFGSVIVEATGRSGSLITARTAAEQGRDVYAVPGSIFSGGSEGTHRLIQYGATLVHDIDDVFHQLPEPYRHLRKPQAPRQVPQEPLREVLEAFARESGTHVEAVAAKLGRSPVAIAESLLQLELDGWIRALPGARYVRVR